MIRKLSTSFANTVGGELRELTENFPTRKDTNISGGRDERNLARALLTDLVLCLRRIDLAATTGRFGDAATEYSNYRRLTMSTVPVALQNAEPWSLFNPTIHDAHYAALRQMLEAADSAGH
jgi:hypothetical protein